MLELASGTGEHAVFLADALRVASWQPSDPDTTARASIDAWRAHAGASNVRAALDLDVTRSPWPAGLDADVVVCVNMLHISPWAATPALMARASEVLGPGGVLYLYGPYRRFGAHTAPSNEAFDQSLKRRNAEWGVRDLEAVVAEAEARGLGLEDVVPMPANNFSVIFRRG